MRFKPEDFSEAFIGSPINFQQMESVCKIANDLINKDAEAFWTAPKKGVIVKKKAKKTKKTAKKKTTKRK